MWLRSAVEQRVGWKLKYAGLALLAESLLVRQSGHVLSECTVIPLILQLACKGGQEIRKAVQILR